MNSEMAFAGGQSGEQGGGEEVVTTMTFPPGAANMVGIDLQPAAAVEESNVNVVANMSTGAGPMGHMQPASVQYTQRGEEITSYHIPPGQDATIMASNMGNMR